ncbi:hypothetical protein CK203_011762 [Vitis vinifera]|nr:hypothetical protein CK203_011762 [Vitis vinifera]
MDIATDSVGSSMHEPPLPPSPDCDEVGLLKSVQLMPSLDTVTAQWPSSRDESQIHCLLDLRSDGNDKVEEGAIDMPSF